MVAIRRYKPIDGDDNARHRTLFHQIPTVADKVFGETSGEQSTMIAEAKVDEICPECGLSIEDGFDLGIENGKVFGARCPRCGWSF